MSEESINNRPAPIPGRIGNIYEMADPGLPKGSPLPVVFKTMVGTLTHFDQMEGQDPGVMLPWDREKTPWIPNMSIHFWRIDSQNPDAQTAHKQDEFYYIIEGEGVLKMAFSDPGKSKVPVQEVKIKKGDLIYIPKSVWHRLEVAKESKKSELYVLVIFSPDYTG